VPDDVLSLLADNGGVCMVTFVREFLVPAAADWHAEAAAAAAKVGIDAADLREFDPFEREYGASHPKPRGTVDDVVRHIEHVRDVAGIDHIGLGGDYDGTDAFPVGLSDVSGYPLLFATLMDRGWSEGDLAKLAGGNILRVLRAADTVAD